MTSIPFLKPPTLRFVKAVVNPIDADEPATVPDLVQPDSMCLLDTNQLTRPTNTNAAIASGILIWLRVHESPFYTANAAAGTYTYSLQYAYTDNNGLLLLNSGGKFDEVSPTNLTTSNPSIQGGATITPNSALVTGLRVFSMGLRVLPTIEYVTDSTTTTVLRYIGAQMSMQELGSIVANNINVEVAIASASCTQTYANNQGCSVRYNPFQNENQLRVQSLEDCLNTAQSFTYYKMPVIFARFSNGIAATTGTSPLIIHAKYWIEGVIRKPTPIYSRPSDSDILYPMIRTALAGCGSQFPLVTPGHSFPSLLSIGIAAARLVNNVTGGLLNLVEGKKPAPPRAQPKKQPRRRRPRRRPVRRPPFAGYMAPRKGVRPIKLKSSVKNY